MTSGQTISRLDHPGAAGRTWTRVSPGAVMAAATVVALGIRLFTLTRPGFLTHSTEYDDGIYLGAAVKLTEGVLPYHGFAFVQPPGILLLMAPAALVARATSTASGLALARVLTVLASTACVPLAGNLVRYRGVLVTALACFILAVYPADIATAHTLLLEPWMNLLCLIAATIAFRDGRLSGTTAHLALAGVFTGFAATVKFWALAPAAVLLAVLLLNGPAARRVIAYLAGLACAFVLPLLAFIVAAPSAFVHSTIVYQAARVGTYTPLSLRLAHLTGVIDVLDYYGKVTLTAGANSLFGQAVLADTAPSVPHLLPYLAAALLGAVIVAGFVRQRRDTTPVEWFALATFVIALGAILLYSAFFYHYPAFPGPWLAIVTAVAAGTLLRAARPVVRRAVTWLAAAVLAGAMILQFAAVAAVALPAGMDAFEQRIPAGACVVTDQVSFTIAANRFTSDDPGCPVVIDSLATTLVLTHGVSVQGGAARDASAVAAWRAIMSRAQYVWLSPNVWRRLPWRDGYFPAWFTAEFRQVWPRSGWVKGLGNLFERR